MLTVSGTESVVAFVGCVISLRGEKGLVITFLKLHRAGTRTRSRLNHFPGSLEISLVVGTDFGNNIRRSLISDDSGADSK